MNEFIHSYSRKQAIEDGILIDVSQLGREAGFLVPVAITVGLYTEYIKTDLPDQDETGRLWDTLVMLAVSARHSKDYIIIYNVLYKMANHIEVNASLKAVIDMGENGFPEITIMLIDES